VGPSQAVDEESTPQTRTPTDDGHKMPFFLPEGSKASYPAVAGSDVDGWRRPKPRKLRPWCGVASIIVVVVDGGGFLWCGCGLWAVGGWLGGLSRSSGI
jgi:hypothetical protein